MELRSLRYIAATLRWELETKLHVYVYWEVKVPLSCRQHHRWHESPLSGLIDFNWLNIELEL